MTMNYILRTFLVQLFSFCSSIQRFCSFLGHFLLLFLECLENSFRVVSIPTHSTAFYIFLFEQFNDIPSFKSVYTIVRPSVHLSVRPSISPSFCAYMYSVLFSLNLLQRNFEELQPPNCKWKKCSSCRTKTTTKNTIWKNVKNNSTLILITQLKHN